MHQALCQWIFESEWVLRVRRQCRNMWVSYEENLGYSTGEPQNQQTLISLDNIKAVWTKNYSDHWCLKMNCWLLCENCSFVVCTTWTSKGWSLIYGPVPLLFLVSKYAYQACQKILWCDVLAKKLESWNYSSFRECKLTLWLMIID